MASEISLLIPGFRKLLVSCLDRCKEKGVIIEVITTVISPLEQAALWKQGRSRIDAELKMLALENSKAPYLADCLRRAQPLRTNCETEFVPGMSWHQWGEAVSVVWVDGAKQINWTTKGGANGYRFLVDQLKDFSLHSGSEFDDTDAAWRLVQFRPVKSPIEIYDIVSIDAEMKKRFERSR